MVFVTQIDTTTWLTEHVADPDDGYAARAIRVVWDIEIDSGRVTATPKRSDRMDTGCRNGKTTNPIPVPDDHVDDLRIQIQLAYGVDSDDLRVTGVGGGGGAQIRSKD